MKYIFLDTFALRQITQDHYKVLNDYLEKQGFHLVISSFQLIEYYSPIVEGGDRTARAIQLLAVNPFVIVNQSDICDAEERSYPAILMDLPYRIKSSDIFGNLNIMERMVVLYRMFHEGIPESGFNLKEWVDDHLVTKKDWLGCVEAIISHAQQTQTIHSKNKFTQALDLRFCDRILEAIAKISDTTKHNRQFKIAINKLAVMQERNDSWRLRGIHLSSLIFWYDYIIANKKRHASDEGDILHSMLFPYCSLVVTDASRVDCLEQIQRKENRYVNTRFLRLKDFVAELTFGAA
jgi:hypothetical protein